MQKFLTENRLPYCVVWDLRVCGIKTMRLGTWASYEQKMLASKNGEVPRQSTGRPGKFDLDCSFCKAKMGPPGALKQQYEQVHYQEQ